MRLFGFLTVTQTPRSGMTTSLPTSTAIGGITTASIANTLRLARAEIRQGRFQRSMAVITLFSSIVSSFEAYLQHRRGSFSQWPMWTPVALAAPTVLAAITAIFSERAARAFLPLVSLASLIDGLAGFFLHVRGIGRLPGGFKLGQYNIVMGPPIFAPLLMCSVGLVGLFAGFLRREELTTNPLGTKSQAMISRLMESAGPTDGAITGLPERVAHGRFQQAMALTSGFLLLLSGGEAYFEHMRGSFNQRIMWAPLAVSLPMLSAVVGTFMGGRRARGSLPIFSALTMTVGLLGFILHWRGIKRMPGGFNNAEFNLTLGPPPFAPLLFSAVGLLGFIAALLRRRGA